MPRCEKLESCGLFKVLDVTRQIGAPVELREILELVIRAALGTLKADRGTVFLYDEDNNELYSRVATGSAEIRFPADQGIAGETAQKRAMVNVPDCYADPRFNQEIDRKTGYRTRCLLSIPLIGLDDKLVGVLQVLNKHNGLFNDEDEQLGHILAAQCAVVLQRALLIEERLVKQKMEQDLAVARDIQLAVLPKELPDVEGYDTACWSKPADETGGDIYDVVGQSDSSIALLLGDVTGHGIGPALSVTQMRAMFRLGLRMGADLQSIAHHINEQLKADLPNNRFITAFLGILDSQNHRLEYLSYGQGPLLYYQASTDSIQFLEASGFPMAIPLNLELDIPDPIEMKPGDIFAVITDGFYEYANPEEEMFGKERLAEVVRASKHLSSDALLKSILDSIYRFARGQGQDDDMTAVILKRMN